MDLKVVSKTTKCRDFTVIFAVFSKMHRDFADFLPLFSYSPVDMLLFCYSTNKFFFAPSFAMLLKFRANSLRVSEIRDRNVVHLSIVV